MPPRQRKRKFVNRRKTSAPQSRGALVSSSHAGASLASMAFSTMPLFPPRTFRHLRYSTSVSLTSTSGIPSAYVFRANDLFDPDFTSTGHQPMGFDQMMVFYNHFCVIKSKITAVFRGTGNVSTCALRQDADSTVVTDPDRILEFGGVVSDVLEAKAIYGNSKELSLAVSIARLQGVSNKAMTADPSLRGNAAGSPTEVTYYHVCLWDRAGFTTTAIADVVIDYYAYFLEPRDFSTSAASSTPLSILSSLFEKHVIGPSTDYLSDVEFRSSVRSSFLSPEEKACAIGTRGIPLDAAGKQLMVPVGTRSPPLDLPCKLT